MTHILDPLRIGPLTLRNRIVKTATYEGMSPGGLPSDALRDHHAHLAGQGVALTTVAYGAVHPDGRTFSEQLLVGPEALPGLRALTDAVHAQGGLASIQLAHCGGFSKNRPSDGRAPAGPSASLNAYGVMYGLPCVRAMDEDDLSRTIQAFADAARIAVEAGFDAIEVHCGHGYLVSQFLSPAVNRRTDRWGGSLEGRARLAREVSRAVRQAVGPGVAILAKLNVSDGVAGGFDLPQAIQVARWLAEDGVDAIVPSGGLVFRTPFFLLRGEVPVRQMAAAESSRLQGFFMRALAPIVMRAVPYTSSFFFDDARQIADAVDIPVGLLGGVDSDAAMARALEAGLDFVVLGRALLADPDLVARMQRQEPFQSRCTHCNRCVAEMDLGGVRCVLDDDAVASGTVSPH